MPAITIRPATPGDTPLILHFIRELAIYEEAEQEVLATPAHIQQSLFASPPQAYGLVCMQGEQAIGFAVYFFNYSTWQGRRGLYLEDVYITPQARGQGAGRALLQHLARIALAHDCGRFEWSVLDWNTPAIGFYDSLGAQAQSEWLRYRLAGDALRALAQEQTQTQEQEMAKS